MKTAALVAQLVGLAVLSVPLSVQGTSNEETIRDLRLTRFVEPHFPENLRVEGVAEGSVTLAVDRNSAGEPVDILVVHSTHPKLTVAAEEAVRQWRFAPEKDAAWSRRLIQLNFKLEGVIVFPAGKNMVEEMASRTIASGSQSLAPDLQSLNPVPKAVVQPMPQYPALLAGNGLTGRAKVSFYVDEAGRVRLPEVIDATAPEFGAAAVAAVAQWRYEPPRANGRPVVAREHWEFNFQAVN